MIIEHIDSLWLAGAKEIEALAKDRALKSTDGWYGAANRALADEIARLQQEISKRCAPWFEVQQ